MAQKPLSRELAEQAFRWVQECIDEGFAIEGYPSALSEASRRHGMLSSKMWRRIDTGKRLYGMKLTPKPGPEEPPYRPEWTKLPPEPIPQPPQPPPTEAVYVSEPKENADQIVRDAIMRGPKTAAELMVKARVDVTQLLNIIDAISDDGARVVRVGDRFEIPKVAQMGFLGREPMEFISEPDNTFKFGAVSDNHCGSKYERRDVFEDLYDRFAQAGFKHVFHAGNYLEGDSRFNKHEVVATGLNPQAQLLAETYPQRDGITTYAVWGDDHEGWYASQMGVDVGAYCESVMRRAGREDWVDLGFLEAHVKLTNANTGAFSMMSVVHPGGGSSYALSYSIQKIIEALDGGEKPAVGLYGHYHKMWSGNIRNVWCIQTGCGQDQSTFIRKNKIQAHAGGVLVHLEQDPESGAIMACLPNMVRYFNKGFYEGRWSKHGPVNMAERALNGV